MQTHAMQLSVKMSPSDIVIIDSHSPPESLSLSLSLFLAVSLSLCLLICFTF